MNEVDYIIVGCGLAGISFCEELRVHHKTCVVFDDQSQQSSVVAAGLYNPVILKRFTAVWNAKTQLQKAGPFYEDLENLLGVKLDYKLPVYRRFASVEEQNDWFSAADNPALESFLSPEIVRNESDAIDAPFGFGKVRDTGRIDTATLIKHYKLYLKTVKSYRTDTFDYSLLTVKEDHVVYKNIKSRFIVFAEGFGMVKNPYFKYLPLQVAKGEVLTIKAPNLKIDYIVKSSVFLVPENNDCYSVGATYNWEDQTNETTDAAKTELLNKLNNLIRCPYEVVHQVAGIRPTVKDRRPLVGTDAIHRHVAVLNGLGTRGVMIGPFVAKQLYEHLEEGMPLDAEIDIQRFQS